MTHKQILEVLMDRDEITWKNVLFDIVKEENMDPWDLDISALTKRYLEAIKSLKEMDFQISGKVVLAAALLLRMKSKYLLTEEMNRFDNIMSGEDESMLYDGPNVKERQKVDMNKVKLIPRTPQPRQRKVSIYDLVDALHEALNVQRKRVLREVIAPEPKMEIPEKKFNINQAMEIIYAHIGDYFQSPIATNLKFSQLLKDDTKESKVFTFTPILHLVNAERIDVNQETHFADFDILLNNQD